MTEIPEDELWTLPDPSWFEGKLVYELGNKKNKSGLYRDWYVANGAEYVCFDWNEQDGAIAGDFGQIIPQKWQGKADLVTNFGFTEHVYTDQKQAWWNLLQMAGKDGAILSIVLPYPTHWDHHGVYQPTPRWLYEFLGENGFKTHLFTVNDTRKRWTICAMAERMKAFNEGGVFYPSERYKPVNPHSNRLGSGVYITPPQKRVNPAEKNCGVNQVWKSKN